MSKLLRLKEWVTISDAAQYLSHSLSEPVSEADVLKLALDDRLVLSIYLPNGLGVRRYEQVPEAEIAPRQGLMPDEWNDGTDVNGKTVIWFRGQYLRLCANEGLGVSYLMEGSTADLAMRGSERSEVEDEFHARTDGLALANRGSGYGHVLGASGDLLLATDSMLKATPSDEELSEREQRYGVKFVAADKLRDVGTFVVRPAALAALLADADAEQRPPKQPSAGAETRQRRTLLTIIAALCKRAGIDPAARGASMAVASATEELGVPVGDDSIRDILKAIPDALESRSR